MASALLDALSKLTQADLDQVNKELDELQAQVAQMTELKRVIEVKLGVSKPRGWHLKEARAKAKAARSSKPEAESDESSVEAENASAAVSRTEQYRAKAREYLMANGTTKLSALASNCSIPHGSISAVVKHRWFTNGTAGVGLSAAAYSEK